MPVRDTSSPQPKERRLNLAKKKWLLQVWQDIQWPLIAVLGLLVIVLGTIGFTQYYASARMKYSVLDSLYQALQLFPLNSGNIAPPVPWMLQVARFLAPVVTFYTLILFLSHLFSLQLQLLRILLTHKHVIICGLGQKGMLLVKDYCQRRYMVVVIEQNESVSDIELCRELGAVVLVGDAREPYVLRQAGVQRAKYLISVCGDDRTNASVAMQARDLVCKRRGADLTCIVHIVDTHLWSAMREQELTVNCNEGFRVEFFNIFTSGARILLREYPLNPMSTDGAQHPPHILVVGMNDLGESMIMHSAQLWNSYYLGSNGKRIQVTVVDPDAELKIRSICTCFSLISTVCVFKAISIADELLASQLVHQICDDQSILDISYAFICLNDPATALTTALGLYREERLRNTRIIISTREDTNQSTLLHNLFDSAEIATGVYNFNLLENTCGANLFDDGTHESLARAIHESYLHNEALKGNTPASNASMVLWKDLTELKRETNRQQADAFGRYLNKIGCYITQWLDFGAESFTFTLEEVESLAQEEHKRWRNELESKGWKYGPERNVERKLHPCLVPWEELPEVEREKDRNTIRNIPEYLSRVGFQVNRK